MFRPIDRFDPTIERFIRSTRSALATFDREDSRSTDRHAETCDCPLCHFVRHNRLIVAEYDVLPSAPLDGWRERLLTVLAMRHAVVERYGVPRPTLPMRSRWW